MSDILLVGLRTTFSGIRHPHCSDNLLDLIIDVVSSSREFGGQSLIGFGNDLDVPDGRRSVQWFWRRRSGFANLDVSGQIVLDLRDLRYERD